MKKKLIVLFPALALMLTGCNLSRFIPSFNHSGDSNNYNSGDTSDVGNSSNTTPSVSSETQKEGLDLLISQFVSGTGLEVPSLNEYSMEYEIFYTYEYQNYVIGAYVPSTSGLDAAYNRKFSGTNWVSWNDDDWYPVEEYGYMWVDDENNPQIEIYFQEIEGYFAVTIYRDDGGAGTADVSNVDTSWYVDYVREYGLGLYDSFPGEDIKDFLNLSITPVDPVAKQYVCAGFEEGEDEDGYYQPATYYVLTETNDSAAYAKKLEAAGYTVNVTDVETFNWDTFEVEEYKAYEAFDEKHELLIKFQDNGDPFMITYTAFGDVYTDVLTKNTDWTDDEKKVMTDNFGEVLPFVTLGDGYIVTHIEGSEYSDEYVLIYDNYYLDLTDKIVDALENAGFTQIEDELYGVYYVKDNRTCALEVFVGYEGGNYLSIYFGESQYVEATDIDLGLDEIECVAGYEFDLLPELTPLNATSVITYTSSSEDVTVDKKGHVVVSKDAAVDLEVTITATAEEGVEDSFVIRVVENVVTSVAMAQDEADIPLGKELALNAQTLPLGSDGEIVWSSSDDTIATVDENGVVRLTADAEVDDVVTITASYKEDDTMFAECEVTVVAVPSYEKVTSVDDLKEGQYLFVNEDAKVALDGDSVEIEKTNNLVDITFSEGKIESSDSVDSRAFTIEEGKEGYTIGTPFGDYIGHTTTGKNTLDRSDDPLEVDISFDSNGNAIIAAEDGYELRYNASANCMRFYKPTSSVTGTIQLYRLAD